MRKITFFLSPSIIVSIIVFTGCPEPGPEPDDLTPQEERTTLLNGIWAVQEITSLPQGIDDTILDNLTMTFGVKDKQPGSFSASGADDFFSTDSSSEWGWNNATSTTSIELTNVSPVTDLTISTFNGTSMTIQFFNPGPGSRIGQRIAVVEGNYTVNMIKQ